MSSTFDPYYKWLAIPPAEQPPNHYRLLALATFESDPDVIATAADQRMAHVRSFQGGQFVDASQRLLNELAAARICLLKPEKKKAYDAALRAKLDQEAARTAPPPPPTRPTAPASSESPILEAPPLFRDAPQEYAAAPVVLAPIAQPAYHAEPVADTFLAETDQPDAVAESTAPVAFAEPDSEQITAAQAIAAQPAAAYDEDDPLGLSDARERYPKQTTLVRRSKKGIPAIFFIGPLLGIGAVVAAVVYSNLRDTVQADLDTARRESRATARHSSTDAASISSKSPSKTKSVAEANPPAFSFSPPNGPNQDFAAPTIPDSQPAQSPLSAQKSPDEHPADNKPTAARLPVPNADEQRKALVEIKKIFKEDFSKAITIDGREALIKKLSDEATATKDDPTTRYVLATQALDEAVKICDIKMASGLVAGLCFYYDVDSWELKSKTLVHLAAGAKSAEARLLIAGQAFSLVDKALSEERYDAAVQLSTCAADLAATVRDTDLRKKTIEANARAHRMQQEAAEVLAAQERLAVQSDNAAAHLLIGRFYCMERDDWDSGLPHLLHSGDADFSALAQRELAGAVKPEEQLALADAWWDLADRRHDSTDAPLVKSMRKRAIYWYRRALPQLSGFAKSKAEKRVAESSANTSQKP